jgi:hypothetical protein
MTKVIRICDIGLRSSKNRTAERPQRRPAVADPTTNRQPHRGAWSGPGLATR